MINGTIVSQKHVALHAYHGIWHHNTTILHHNSSTMTTCYRKYTWLPCIQQKMLFKVLKISSNMNEKHASTFYRTVKTWITAIDTKMANYQTNLYIPVYRLLMQYLAKPLVHILDSCWYIPTLAPGTGSNISIGDFDILVKGSQIKSSFSFCYSCLLFCILHQAMLPFASYLTCVHSLVHLDMM